MKLKKYKKIILILSIIILVVILSLIFLLNYLKYKKYDIYKVEMEKDGFNEYYNNGSASSYQKVTKLEAIKMIFAIINDYKDMGIDLKNDENVINYALKLGILTTTENDSINDKATYIDVIRYISNSNYYILDNQYNTEVTPNFKDYNNYSQLEKVNINDLVSNEIIENSNGKLNGQSKISKGLFNKTILNFYKKIVLTMKYGKIKTDSKDLPSNADEYTFILEDVDNKVYEEEFKKDTSNINVTEPIEYYGEMKEFYISLKEQVEKYYKIVLNIDYRTINVEEFKKNIRSCSIDIIDDYSINKYIDYIKDNQVIMTGKATIQMPIVYKDGFYTRVRTKLEFNIENSKTMDNLIFLDLNSGSNITYKEKNMVLYVDNMLSTTMNDKKPYMKFDFIKDIILDMSKDKVEIKKANKEGT